MKFKYGNYKSKNDIGKHSSSVFDQFIDTKNLTEEITLKQVANEIKDLLKIENGEVELVIGFRYTKMENEK